MPPVPASLTAQMTAWRHHLHAHPELATEEVETANFIAATLRDLGISHTRGIGGHGIVATLQRPGSARAVGLRADMDALPIAEETGAPWASKTPGRMHACGHDGHTASLLGAAQLLRDDPTWSGSVHLIFQPAEEGGIGAKAMLDDGILTRFPMDAVFAYHNWPGLAAGTIGLRPGAMMAAGSKIRILLRGKAAHAAMPHEGRDPLLAAAHLITALQSVAARVVAPVDSAVVSITTLRTGLAYNQIADRVELGGTLRVLSDTTREVISSEIQRICAGVALTFGIEAEVGIGEFSPLTWNAPEGYQDALRGAEASGAQTDTTVLPSMAGEDFARFLNAVPGALVWIGNGAATPGRELHSPQYDFNDAILPVAANWYREVAKAALQRNA